MAATAAPTSLVATASKASFSLSWNAPVGVTNYIVKYSANSSFPSNATTTTLYTNTTSRTVTGLNNGTKYYVKVAALVNNIVGTYATANVTTFGVPAAPSGLKVAPGFKQALVTWVAPTVTNGSAVTGYKIDYSADSTFTNGVTTVDAGNIFTSTITGLADGINYYFRVRAVNSIGEGTNTSGVAGKTYGIPSQSLKVAATAGAATVKFTWAAPVNNGSAVTGYSFDYSTDSTFTTGVTTVALAGNILTYSPTGLAPNTVYYGRVYATNAVGSGIYSTTVSATTFNIPDAPVSISGVPSSVGSLKLTWVSPTNTNGTPVTGYVVQYSRDANFSTGVGSATVGKVLTFTATGLAANQKYYFRVAAKTLAGTGAYSTSSFASTWSTPQAPTGLTLTSLNKSFKSVWAATTSNGGTPVTGYRVQYSTDATFATLVTTVDLGNVLTLSPKLLSDNTIYYVRVASKNLVGFGTFGAPVAVTTFNVPDAPIATVTGGLNIVTVNWTAPASNGGSPVTGYRVEYSVNPDMGVPTSVAVNSATALTSTITKLASTTKYYVRVYAKSVVGESGASTIVSANTINAPPAPTVTNITSGHALFNISWNNNAVSQSPITGYRLEYSIDSDFSSSASVLLASAVSATTVKSLLPGATYYVRIYAKSLAGESIASSVSTITTTSGAVAPTNFIGAVSYVPGIGSTTALTWTAPTDTSGLAIVGYNIQYATDANFILGVKTVATKTTAINYVITGLNPSSTYFIRVAAITAAGVGDYTEVISVTTAATAVTPTGLALSSGVKSISTNWNAVDGVTSYTVQVSTANTFLPAGTTTITTSNTSYNFTGLLDGKVYYVRVASVNDLGIGAYSAFTSKSTLALPAAPKGLVALDNGDGSASISWTALSPTATAPIDGYRMEYSRSNTFTSDVNVIDSASSSNKIIIETGTYYVRIAAVNNVGVGIYSTAVPVIVTNTPSAPSDVVASLNADKTISITWTASDTDNGKAITGYTINVSGGTGAVTYPTAREATTATVSGLEPGKTYTFTVQANNANGSSANSNVSNGVLNATVPDAPASFTATVANVNKIDLAWTAPANDGDSTITGYEVNVSNGEGTVTVEGTTAIVTGLTTGSTYTFKVKAINAMGSSVEASVSKLIATVPNVISSPTVSVDSISSLDVSWLASEFTGAPITGYTVEYADNTEFTGSEFVNTLDTMTRLENLTAGTTYYIRVAATNALGSSEYSSASGNKPGASPSSINGVTLSLNNYNTAEVTWNAPQDNGYAVTGYRLEYSTDSTFTENLNIIDTVQTTALVNNIAPDTTVYVRIAAINIRGTSPYSSFSSILTPSVASAPQNVTSTVSSITSVDLTWDAPASDGRSDITGYEITVSGGDGAVTINGTTATATGLTTGKIYTFNIKAINAVGKSTSTSVSLLVATIPSKISTPISSVDGENSILISWAEPASNGSAITGYIVEYADNADFTGVTSVNVTETSKTLTGLTANTTYYVRIIAANVLGNSESSDIATVQTPTVASEPQAVTATVNSESSITLDWSAPADTGRTPVTEYEVTVSNESGTVTYPTDRTAGTATVNDLAAGSTYIFTVKATNAVGKSTGVTLSALTFASAPTGLSVAKLYSTSNVNLTWNAPTNATSVTDYKVQYSTDGATWNDVSRTASTIESQAVSGLVWNTAYQFRVASVNSSGVSVYTSISASTSIPAPTTVTATPTAGSASSINISWVMPTTGSVDSISDYIVEYSTNGTSWAVYTHTASTATSITVAGLTEATQYIFRVKTVAVSGATSDYKQGTAVYTSTTPSSVGGVSISITPANMGSSGTSMTAYWYNVSNTSPSAANGYSTITGYTVKLFNGTRGNSLVSTLNAANTANSITFAVGSNTGDYYYVTVTATNSAGRTSVAASSSAALAPIQQYSTGAGNYAGPWVNVSKYYGGSTNKYVYASLSCPAGMTLFAKFKIGSTYINDVTSYSQNDVTYWNSTAQAVASTVYGGVYCKNTTTGYTSQYYSLNSSVYGTAYGQYGNGNWSGVNYQTW